MLKNYALIKKLRLQDEANLLDSWIYIIKTFFAVSAAYFVFKHVPYAQRDMISVLFGIVCTLEPVNLTGLKSGKDQILASFIGAATTAVIVYFFGVNPLSVGISLAATTYVGVLINWRAVSPVALFTAIYMTQLLQLDAAGNISLPLTMLTRFVALSSGILTAIIANYIFSFIQYRRIAEKRLIHVCRLTRANMENMIEATKKEDSSKHKELRGALIETSNSIDWISGFFFDMLKEKSYQKGQRKEILEKKLVVLNHIRLINQMMFDLNYIFADRIKNDFKISGAEKNLENTMEKVLDNFNHFILQFESIKKDVKVEEDWKTIEIINFENTFADRIQQDLIDINDNILELSAVMKQN